MKNARSRRLCTSIKLANSRKKPKNGALTAIRQDWPFWKNSAASSIFGSTMLNPDFREFIESLNANQVRYLVLGRYAVALHGYPRYTKDIEIWIDRTTENAGKVVQALSDFGLGSLGLKAEDFQEEDQIIQLGYPSLDVANKKAASLSECRLPTSGQWPSTAQ